MQGKYEDRILFLKEFTKELILQSKVSEKKFQEFVEPSEKIEEPKFVATGLQKPETKPVLKPWITNKRLLPKKPVPRYPIRIHPTKMLGQLQKPEQQVMPHPESLPAGFNLGKLNILIKDPRVTQIECPGPGKNILARSGRQVKVTQISLSHEEIQNIISEFSKQAKIPIIQGLFKAAVGNLILTAVVSEIIGNRFIITKMAPASMPGQVRY